MAESERARVSTLAGLRLAAVLCVVGGVALLVLAGFSVPRVFGPGDTSAGGLGVAFVVVLTVFAGLLLHAGHVLWWRSRYLPARILAGFVLVIACVGLIAELAESGGREPAALAGWAVTLGWSVAIPVALARRGGDRP